MLGTRSGRKLDLDQDKIHEWVVKWQSMYEELRQISMKQLERVVEEENIERMESLLDSMHEEWVEKQASILEWEKSLRRVLPADQLKEMFQANIQPLLHESMHNIEQAMSRLEQSMSSVGSTLKRTSDYRMVSGAYNHVGQGDDIPIFFDEKK